VGYSVNELIRMARGLSEGDFDYEFEHHFEGEMARLAAHIDELRRKLKDLSPNVQNSADLIPQAAKGVAEIAQHAQSGVETILVSVEAMLSDQEKVLRLLEISDSKHAQELQSISLRSRRHLINMMSILSFQDVMRQRVESVQGMIDEIEKQMLELLLKFKIKVKEQEIKEENGQETLREEVQGISNDMGLDQALIDELLENLK